MQCPVCESSSVPWRKLGDVAILKCTSVDCGFKFFDLATWTSPYLRKDYYEAWTPQPINPKAPWILARVALLKRFCCNGHVLDLGCGIGETAVALHEAGFEVSAVDDSAKAVDYLSRTFPAVAWACEDLLKYLRARADNFDAITMFHVLEHIPLPKDLIRLADKSLKPGGVILIEVPDVAGGQAKWNGMRWDYYHDHHVNYFSRKALSRLMSEFGYGCCHVEPTFHFSYPQGHQAKDAIKGLLANLGYNSIIRTAWMKEP